MSEQSAPAGRREQFEEEIAAVRIRTGKAEAEQRFTILGLIGLIGGIVICIAAYIASGGQSDTRDVISSVILALVGVTRVDPGRGAVPALLAGPLPALLAPPPHLRAAGRRTAVRAGHRIEPSSLRAASCSQSMPRPRRISSVCWPCSGAVRRLG